MSKKLIEITNEVASKTFGCKKVEGGEAKTMEIDMPVQAIIDTGISNAIPRALYISMDANPREEATLQVGPFVYGVTVHRSGDNLSLNPTFSLANEKKLINELGEYEDKLHKNISVVESIAGDIEDKTFIETVLHCCKLDEFDAKTGEWIEKKTDNDKGVQFEEAPAKLFIAIHVASILHVLANSKNPDELVKYEVPGEGTYTIESKKGNWEIGFIPSKEFKQTIKNDRLIEALA